MGRFSDAKANSDNPTVIRKALNYLAELLDRGYETKLTIAGKKIIISINPKDGISITVNGDKVFGIDSTGALYATKLAYVSNPDTIYGIVGDLPTGGHGLSLYDELLYPANRFFSISSTLSGGVYSGVGLYDTSGGAARLHFGTSGSFVLRNNTNAVINHDPNGSIQIYDANLNRLYVYDFSGGYNEMRFPGTTHALGVDATGPYKVIGGVKTYL